MSTVTVVGIWNALLLAELAALVALRKRLLRWITQSDGQEGVERIGSGDKGWAAFLKCRKRPRHSTHGPTAGVPANSDKSRGATRRGISLGYTVEWTFLDEAVENCGDLFSSCR